MREQLDILREQMASVPLPGDEPPGPPLHQGPQQQAMLGRPHMAGGWVHYGGRVP